ncbi:virion structural protein [Burkholderia phage Bm1]
MIQVPLEFYPQQSLSIVLGNSVWDIALRYADNSNQIEPMMLITISKDGTKLIDGQRCVHGVAVFWDPSLNPDDTSNFMFLTPDGSYPMWNKFNTAGGHVLLWMTGDELATLRATANVI